MSLPFILKNSSLDVPRRSNPFPFLVLLFSFISAFVTTAQKPIRISGSSAEYRGHLIVFYQYQNLVNQQPIELFSIQIDKEGEFDLTYELPNTTYAYAKLGQYQAHIYLEPGHQYQLVLPPYSSLSRVQQFNPFFEPEQIQLGIANSEAEDLNRLILNFDEVFGNFFNVNAFDLFSSQNLQKANAIINKLEVRFPSNNTFFHQHKKYHYARLKRLAARRNERQIIDQYFSHEPVLFHHPAYWQTFKEVFTGAWSRFVSSPPQGVGKNLLTDTTTFNGLSQAMATDTLFSQQDLREALLVWALHEAFYKKTLSEKRILGWMQQASQQASDPETKAMATSLYLKMNQLRPGGAAPSFELKTLKNRTRTLDDYKGKFVYLNFMHTQNHACLKALETMASIAEEFKRELEVVTILVDEESQEVENYLNNRLRPKWDILFFNENSNVLTGYNIQSVPTYFLIDPEGNLVLFPAPSPHENFRETFTKQQLTYHKKQQREQQNKERSILDL